MTTSRRAYFERLEDRCNPAGAGGAEELVVAAGTQLDVDSSTTFHADVQNQGEINVAPGATATYQGLVHGAGDYAGDNVFDGTLSPGNSPAQITFAGNVVFTASNNYIAEIGGATPGTQYDQIIVTGNVTLAGELDVQLINGFTPTLGQRFEIVKFGSRTGDFQTFNGLDLGGGLTLTPQIDVDSYDLVVTSGGGDTQGPRISNVFVRGTGWAASLLNQIQTDGQGSSSLGYSFTVGSSAQLNAIPWSNVNQLSIQFNENVNIQKTDLQLFGGNVPNYDIANSAFSYNSGAFVATWTLTAPIARDKLRVVVNTTVTDTSGNPLDGEWVDAVSTYPSGDGISGSAFRFRFNVLLGNTVMSGNVVNAVDWNVVRGKLFTSPGNANYSIFSDVDGNGFINAADWNFVRGKLFTDIASIPEPGGASAPTLAPSFDSLTPFYDPLSLTSQTRKGNGVLASDAIDAVFGD